MTVNYSALQAKATKLIEKFGNGLQAEINYVGTGKKQKIGCVIVSSDETYLEGSVHRKLQTALVSGALKTAPEANDFITTSRKTYTIRSVEEITPDGNTTCLYKLLVS